MVRFKKIKRDEWSIYKWRLTFKIISVKSKKVAFKQFYWIDVVAHDRKREHPNF